VLSRMETTETDSRNGLREASNPRRIDCGLTGRRRDPGRELAEETAESKGGNRNHPGPGMARERSPGNDARRWSVIQREALPVALGSRELHVWCLTSRQFALSAHAVVSAGADQDVLSEMSQVLERKFKIRHMTVQLERGQPPRERYF
jgi:hypothetical protein